jgi:LmbE family N-acetylglucosaminyl deacetylase
VSRIVAVTPALSDAVQSVGATLARHAAEGHEVLALCVFGVNGDPADEQAAAALGLHGVVHLGLEPAAARGYGDTPFRGLREDDDSPTVAATGLAVAFGRLQPDLVLAPLGLTGHVDHLVVGRALDELDVPRLRWVDLPYALRRTAGAPLGAGELVLVPADAHLEDKLAACASYGAELDRLAAHAAEEGARLGAGGPVEVLLRR